jgi:SEC-C motif-containing protein
MKKIGPNSDCPCGSRIKYKKCCQIYHKGALAKSALVLMKSRYSAYATNNIKYIIKTTHIDSPHYYEDREKWQSDLEEFCQTSQFLKLDILEYIDGKDEAFVTFKATLDRGEIVEKSRFVKVDNRWLYESIVVI